MKKILIENKIDADSDFKYSLQNFKLALVDTPEEAFTQIKNLMQSLKDTASGKDYVVSQVKKIASQWLSKNKSANQWEEPNFDLGNQTIRVDIASVDVSETDTKLILVNKSNS